MMTNAKALITIVMKKALGLIYAMKDTVMGQINIVAYITKKVISLIFLFIFSDNTYVYFAL